MSVLAIDSPPAEVVKTKTNKGKQPDWGTCQPRKENPEDKSTTMTKKCKLAKCISKAILMDTEDEDGPPARPTIFVKPPKGVVPVTPAPSNSKASTLDVTKEVKKDKGKEKAVAVKEPELAPDSKPNLTRAPDTEANAHTCGPDAYPISCPPYVQSSLI
ncbi:hypothetical protein BDR04DRAFT_1153648 [Suillus decipiens]|nr:hypothetical protein BDR04DRAFT_1153648 [Suillus decipiens]